MFCTFITDKDFVTAANVYLMLLINSSFLRKL